MSKTLSLQRPFSVLLVEDNEDDVLLTKHAFKSIPDPVQFQVVGDGLDALRVLRRESPYSDAEIPNLILLDLNMPRMDGRQLLAELKQDEQLKVIPTIILTTSTADDDVRCAYRNYASAYMTKPIDLQEFTSSIHAFAGFWLSGVAILPSQ